MNAFPTGRMRQNYWGMHWPIQIIRYLLFLLLVNNRLRDGAWSPTGCVLVSVVHEHYFRCERKLLIVTRKRVIAACVVPVDMGDHFKLSRPTHSDGYDNDLYHSILCAASSTAHR